MLEALVGKLQEENRFLKLQLEELRQKFFKRNKSRKNDDDDQGLGFPPKKRGAPKGHPGSTRKKPDHVDKHVDVHIGQCPECGGKDLSRSGRFEDHYQEDIEMVRPKVTCFRHHFYYCRACKKAVYGFGEGELPRSYIGPKAKSLSSWLHYQLHLPYRQIRKLFTQVFGLSFAASSCPGFDRQIRIRGKPLYEKMKETLPNKPFIHADETGWRKSGLNHWLWCFGALGAVIYHMDQSRSGKVVTSLLGKKYKGVLVSDFLAAYNRIESRKQRCLVHLVRLIKKRQIYFEGDKKHHRYFSELKILIQEIMKLSKKMATEERPKNFIERKADLIASLRRHLESEVDHPKAKKFKNKLNEKIEELTTCLEVDEVCAHNNWAERLLRGNVIMRKVTFGNRSDNGIYNHEVIMSLIQTLRLHNLDALSFLRLLLTNPSAASHALLPKISSAG